MILVSQISLVLSRGYPDKKSLTKSDFFHQKPLTSFPRPVILAVLDGYRGLRNMTVVIEWTMTVLVMVTSAVMFASALVGVEPWNL